jgi:hypothetical protein
MHWYVIHAWAEEAELWSTLGVNASAIFGGIAVLIGFLRKQPSHRIARFGLIGVTVCLLAAVVAFSVEIATAPSISAMLKQAGGEATEPFETRFVRQALPHLSKEDQARFNAEKRKGMPDDIAFCRATSVSADDVDDCIIILHH